ncbi:FadR/GntR family transcriptional regulator [Rhodococcus globerulus]|uniref:FadR/GntR family transcriptional regulator n=1 Tax=Rhodococcus globerulus TaxID=33008 RepID=A0ABU4C5I7_RHOGO|nr:FadR/GntR family transcriptional regulator [Rhodococcus globerulus]MDV6271782.1 FadR/GntR family transcriptional regulator [Rhodococcus globerulus]
MAQHNPAGLGRIDRPESMVTEIAKRLVDYLLSGAVKPGQRLPSERALAELLGVGRSSLRDAVKPLQLMGLLDVRVGDGMYLKKADSDFLPQVIEWGLLLKATRTLEMVETRLYVEAALATMAAERRSDDELAAMERELAIMKTAPDWTSFTAADTAFHLAVAAAAHNQVLAGILSSIRSLVEVWIGRVVAADPDTSALYEEHRKIFDAVRLKNPGAAGAAMHDHIQRVTELLKQTLAAAD